VRGLWQNLLRAGRRAPRRLRLCESLALGERRFVAVIEYGQTRFLLGGTGSSLTVLARLADAAAEKQNSSAAWVPSGRDGESDADVAGAGC